MKLTIIGNLFGTSGYAVHTRQLANGLMNQGTDVKIITGLHQGWEFQVNDKELEAIKKDDNEDRIGIYIGLPNSYRLFNTFGYTQFGGFVVWEGDTIPEFWKEHIEECDFILTPSEHTKKAIEKVCPDYNNVFVIPHGVDSKLFIPPNKDSGSDHEDFTFITNGGWVHEHWDRKGIQFLTQAFCEEFTKEDKVKLIVKLNPAYPQQFDVTQKFNTLNKNQLKIWVNNDPIDYKLMPSIYQNGDIYVSTTMAESFNIPGLEAMACGLPTLQTKSGGQTDYMTDKNSFFIEGGELFTPPHDVTYEGVKWIKPDIKEIRKMLRYCYEHQDEVKAKGKQALKDVQNWTWDKSAEKLIKILKK